MILTDIVQLVENLFMLVYYILMISAFLGKLIVQALGYVWHGLSTVYSIVVPALVALYGDYTLFYHDVCNIVKGIWTFTIDGINGTITAATDCVTAVSDGISATYTVISNIITERLLPFPILTLRFVKELLILIGEGVWLLITLPFTIPQIIGKLCIRAVDALLWRIIGIIKTVYEGILVVVIDFPEHALVGLLLLTLAYLKPQATKAIGGVLWKGTRILYSGGMCAIGRACVGQWRMAFLWLARTTRQLLFHVAMAFVTVRARTLRLYDAEVRPFVNVIQTVWSFNQPVNQRPAERNSVPHNCTAAGRRPSISSSRSPTGPVGLCIICEDRQKSVALVPCGHICMCKQCTIQLSYYNSVCPLCRRMFRSRLDVYF